MPTPPSSVGMLGNRIARVEHPQHRQSTACISAAALAPALALHSQSGAPIFPFRYAAPNILTHLRPQPTLLCHRVLQVLLHAWVLLPSHILFKFGILHNTQAPQSCLSLHNHATHLFLPLWPHRLCIPLCVKPKLQQPLASQLAPSVGICVALSLALPCSYTRFTHRLPSMASTLPQ